jgi:hypothetical protein
MMPPPRKTRRESLDELTRLSEEAQGAYFGDEQASETA